MKIVTGYTGTEHITSNDDQGRNQGFIGTGAYILPVGSKFEPSVSDATHISIADGEGLLQGVHFRVEPGTSDTVAIDSGTSGQNRIDLICARYTKDAVTGVEDVSWAVVKGTASSGTPTMPSYTYDDILGGALLCDFPIIKVSLTGVAVAVSVFTGNYLDSLSDAIGDITTLSGYVVNIMANYQLRKWTSKHRSVSALTINSANSVDVPIAIQLSEDCEVMMAVEIETVSAYVAQANILVGTQNAWKFVGNAAPAASPNLCVVNASFIGLTGEAIRIPVLGAENGTINVRLWYWQRPTSVQAD